MTAPTLTVTVGPRNAYTDPQSGLRYYRWQGRDLPSVTSVRRMAGLPHGLHQWSLSQVINHALDNIVGIQSRVGTGDPGQLALVKSELRKAATAERDRAAALGTAVHDAAASGAALTDVAPEIASKLRQLYDWLERSGAEILAREFQVFNLTLGYAGTADVLCRFRDGSVWVIDYKTGKGLYGEHALQLMAYRNAEFIGADDVVDDELTGLLHIATGMAVLHLSDDGWAFHGLEDDPLAWRAFRGLLAFSTWMAGHESIDAVTAAVRRGAA